MQDFRAGGLPVHPPERIERAMQQTRSILLATAAAALLAGGIGSFSSTASACNLEPSIGSVCAYAFDWCPRGYIQADGRQVAVASYQALFSLIGYRYGGNGADAFAVPDLRGRAVYGKGLGPLLNDIVNIGQQIGQQWLMLSWNQVPLYPHTHTAVFEPTKAGNGPVQASGNATLNFSNAPVSGLTVTSTPSLSTTVTIPAPLVAANVSGTTTSPPTTGGILARPSAGGATIYTTGTADTQIGKSQTATAPVTGTVASTASGGTVSGSATGNVTLPVSGSLVTGGKVTVAPVQQPATMPVSTQSPGLGQTYCIATAGLYPDRP